MRVANDNSPLPFGVVPRGFSREQAAAYVGISTSKFDELVKAGSMPSPKLIGTRTIWDRLSVDSAFDELPSRESVRGDKQDETGRQSG